MSQRAQRGNNLLFKTEPAGQTIEPGKTVVVTGTHADGIHVQPFYTIRVVAGNRIVSEGSVTLKLITKIDQINFLVLDILILDPGEQLTRTYHAPGLDLVMKAEVPDESGVNAIDVAVFGFRF
ncbi:hypothetical protein SAMN05216353_11135 [Halobacillus alkaliphilus]|uniref:Uncharacterized protein n=1 Tax=Halobacillus alkaliphilus TaxID=396056 RepID=A0A1I2M360_9BACI|nr:hypothetical protein [Halobacillus alkaliphilus]SFF85893.1 hypothetical protein SAMN05216353_11135 [Halobacillus alkaliphilus]